MAKYKKNITEKECFHCHVVKSIEMFDRKGKRLFAQCKECRKEVYYKNVEENRRRAREFYSENKERVRARGKERHRKDPRIRMVSDARRRASRKNVLFDLSIDDIKVPAICPILGIPIFVGDGSHTWNSPTLDRMIPSIGYVKGNVLVVSMRANSIKSDATLDEMRKMLAFCERRIEGDG